MVWAVDLGVKYLFGFGGIYVSKSDPVVNLDVDPHVTRQRIPEVSALRGEWADSQDFGVREQRKSFSILPFTKIHKTFQHKKFFLRYTVRAGEQI